MILEWIVSTLLFSACVYLLVMVFYFKTLLRKEKRSNIVVKHTLSDAEVVIRKYQVQLQRSLRFSVRHPERSDGSIIRFFTPFRMTPWPE